jgi:hypothetical protein
LDTPDNKLKEDYQFSFMVIPYRWLRRFDLIAILVGAGEPIAQLTSGSQLARNA